MADVAHHTWPQRLASDSKPATHTRHCIRIGADRRGERHRVPLRRTHRATTFAGVTAPETAPPAAPAHPPTVFDAPLMASGLAPTMLAYKGATTEQIADEIRAQYDLTTQDGWTAAMRSLPARPEVLRHLVETLVKGFTHPDFKWALNYVTNNGIGRPLERIQHSGQVGVVVVTPPIRWTDDPSPSITATAKIDVAA